MKHKYTSELELKSLLIRIKNKRLGIGVPKENVRINKYIRLHAKLGDMKYRCPKKKNELRAKTKLEIVRLSELTSVDEKSYERFGTIILLMIKNILRKSQFSGYTYKDDFYSDAIYKILKYLNNFNHLLISKITNAPVNAFAYISQIIHNSVVYIIVTEKKKNTRQREYIQQQQIANNVQSGEMGWSDDNKTLGASKTVITKMFYLENTQPNGLLLSVDELLSENQNADFYEIFFENDYEISFDELAKVKEYEQTGVKIKRGQEND